MSVEERKRKRECGGEREKEGVRDTKTTFSPKEGSFGNLRISFKNKF